MNGRHEQPHDQRLLRQCHPLILPKRPAECLAVGPGLAWPFLSFPFLHSPFDAFVRCAHLGVGRLPSSLSIVLRRTGSGPVVRAHKPANILRQSRDFPTSSSASASQRDGGNSGTFRPRYSVWGMLLMLVWASFSASQSFDCRLLCRHANPSPSQPGHTHHHRVAQG